MGVALANNDKKVLLIDLDYTIARLIDIKIDNFNYNIDKDKYILRSEGVDIIPPDIRLSSTEKKILNVINRKSIIKNIITSLKNNYNYILIDCLPSLGTLNINALVASDSVIIPVQAQYFSIRGMEQLLQSIVYVRTQINPKLSIEGILITMYDKRTNLSKEIKKIIYEMIFLILGCLKIVLCNICCIANKTYFPSIDELCQKLKILNIVIKTSISELQIKGLICKFKL